MKQEEFAAVVLGKDILTKNELVTFFQFFSSTLATPVGFSNIRRSGDPAGICHCRRFRSLSPFSLGYSELDYLVFSVDKDITLHGLSLTGSENKDYTGELQVKIPAIILL